MSDILKPCANCGATDPHDGTRGQAPAAHRHITCVHCGMTAPSVEAWNRRALSPAVKALVKAVKALLPGNDPARYPNVRYVLWGGESNARWDAFRAALAKGEEEMKG